MQEVLTLEEKLDFVINYVIESFGIDAICEEVQGELEIHSISGFSDIDDAFEDVSFVFGNRELCVFIGDDVFEYCVDFYGDRKVLVKY